MLVAVFTPKNTLLRRHYSKFQSSIYLVQCFHQITNFGLGPPHYAAAQKTSATESAAVAAETSIRWLGRAEIAYGYLNLHFCCPRLFPNTQHAQIIKRHACRRWFLYFYASCFGHFLTYFFSLELALLNGTCALSKEVKNPLPALHGLQPERSSVCTLSARSVESSSSVFCFVFIQSTYTHMILLYVYNI